MDRKEIYLALMLLLLISPAVALESYSTGFEGSEPLWECHTPDQTPDVCTTDATDHHSSGSESANAHKEDGLCGVAGGISREFSLSNPPETLNLDLKAKADDWGSTAVYIKDESGYNLLWEKYAGGYSYETGWMTKSFDISSYDKDFRLIIGNNDDSSQYCNNSDHSWWIWADEVSVIAENPPAKPSNPVPADGINGRSDSVKLEVTVSDPNGDSMDVTFYDASDDSQIGSTQTDVPDGGSASVTWNGLDWETSYNWYAVAEQGEASATSDTWSFTTNDFPSASFTYKPQDPQIGESISFNGTGSSDGDSSISSYEWDWTEDGAYEITGSNPTHSYDTEGSYNVKLRVTDEYGAEDTITRTVEIKDQQDPVVDSLSPKGTINNRRPQISGSFSDNNELDSYNLDLDGSKVDSGSLSGESDSSAYKPGNDLATGSHTFTWMIIDSAGNTGSRTETFYINSPPNQVPSEDHPADGSTIYNDSTYLEVTVSDPDGDNMDVEFLNNVSNASKSERTDSSVPDGEKASVDINLERGKTYKWWVEVSDDRNKTKSGDWGFYVNELPDLFSSQPSDAEVYSRDEIILNASGSDKESSYLNAYFYDENDNFIGKDSGPEGAVLSSEIWKSLKLGETYHWKLKLSDGYENRTFADLSFLRSTPRNFRVQQQINHDYSSIIAAPESATVFTLDVSNRLSNPRSATTYLEGVNAYFDRNREDSYSYTLPGAGSKEFLVSVRPQDTNAQELRVITESPQIGINTTETIPVTVQSPEPVGEARSVPGIGLWQLFVLALVSIPFYLRQV